MGWVENFLKRQKFTAKKATIISTARKAVIANPFLIYDFYDIIKRIWNSDESGFPTYLMRCKVVAPMEKPDLNTTCGAGLENIIVLATSSTFGRVLDPLIVFSGKNFQSLWKGKNALLKIMH